MGDVYEGLGLRKAGQKQGWLEERMEVSCRSDIASINPDYQHLGVGLKWPGPFTGTLC